MRTTFRMLSINWLKVYLLILVPICASGQLSDKVKLSNVDIVYKDDIVNVPYTLYGLTGENYVVWVEFFDSKDDKIFAKTFSGDINYVKGSGNKTISWDIKKDNIVIDENIYAKVNAKLIPPTNSSKALLKSTIYPGWGDQQYNYGKSRLYVGLLGYSMIGASTLMHLRAKNSLNDYQKSRLSSSDDPSYSNGLRQRNISNVFAGLGIAIWAYDYYYILKKSKNHNNPKKEIVIANSYYKLYSNSSLPIRVNTRGLPPNLFADLNFSDENNNGLLEAHEKAVLDISISNQGKGDALQLGISVTDSTYDKCMVISNATQKINALKVGESVKISVPISTDWALNTATHKLTINVSEQYGYDMDPAYLVLETISFQPKLTFSGLELIDSGPNTVTIISDGKLQAGEHVKAKLVVQNIGNDIARNTSYSIKSSDANIYLDDFDGQLGDLMSGEMKEIFFTISPNKRVTAKGDLPIFLTLKEAVGLGDLKDFQLPIALNQKPPQTNIVTIKPNIESHTKKNVARFEFKSNKFRTNISNVTNIASVSQSKKKRPNSVGVVFGINSYKELPPAPYADNDAKLVKEYFEKVLGVEQVIIYTNEQASGFIFDDVFNPENGEILKAIIKGVTEVFVFYSGHGIPDKSGQNIYLFPSDGKISRLETQGYNIEKLYQNLSKLGAKHVTVIIDACFSGGSRKSEKIQTENLISQKGVKVRPKNTWLVDPSFTIISSSTGEETSLGFDASETGLFTYYLCAGLQGKADVNNDKVITMGELKNYIIQNVTETSKKISGLQTPIFTGDENIVITSY